MEMLDRANYHAWLYVDQTHLVLASCKPVIKNSGDGLQFFTYRLYLNVTSDLVQKNIWIIL